MKTLRQDGPIPLWDESLSLATRLIGGLVTKVIGTPAYHLTGPAKGIDDLIWQAQQSRKRDDHT